MKILAIRGKNLASLAAEFEIDFQKEPLASAGLYAITGPTGSGKSTLLDALCLALYERTPRLSKAGSKGETIPDTGENTIGASDPRTLLRRNAGEGFAEVDFVGSDGVGYRSRWSVRRAHGKGSGKLQASEMTLMRIAGDQQLGDHTKTATLALVEKCVGLSFEQFTRAVLLAQNDFATFLRAADDERAELLQTLTGTEKFAEISMLAYERMKAENQTLDALKQQLMGQQPMPAEVRAEKDAQLQTQTNSAGLLDKQRANIEGYLRWYEQWDKLQAELNAARTSLVEALDAEMAAAPRQAQLSLLEQVQLARPLWSDLDRVARRLNDADQSAATAVSDLALSRQLALSSQAECDAAQQRASAADLAKTTAQGNINQARTLDAGIDALTPQALAAQNALVEAQRDLEEAMSRQTSLAASHREAQEELRTTTGWLAGNEQSCALAQGWPRWKELIDQAQATRERHQQGNDELADLEKQAATNALENNGAAIKANQAREGAAEAMESLNALTQTCAAVNADQLAREHQAHEDRRDQLQAASVLWRQRTEAAARQKALQDQREDEEASVARCETELQECAISEPKLEGEVHSAEQALHLARLAAGKDAATMRTDLQAGQPCPVCGAVDHPYAIHSPTADAMLQGLQEHVESCKAAQREMLNRSTLAGATKAAAEKTLASVAKDLTQLARQDERLVGEWTTLELRDEIDGVAESDRHTWLQLQQEGERQALVQLGDQETAHRDNLKRKDEAQQRVNKNSSLLESARQTLDSVLAAGARIEIKTDSARRQLAELANQINATLFQLDEAFVGATWRLDWEKSAQDFAQQCQAKADIWNQHQKLCISLAQRIDGLRLQVEAACGTCTLATQQRDAQSRTCESIDQTLQTQRQQRDQLFEGRALAEVESALDHAVAAAKSELENARSALQNASAEVNRKQEAERQTNLQVERLRGELAQAQAQLDNWLSSFNVAHRIPHAAPTLSQEQLVPLLGVDPADIAQERTALQAIQYRLSAAQAVLASRNKSLLQHEATKATSENAAALTEELAKVVESAQALDQTLSALKLDIGLDETKLLESAKLRLNVDRQAAVARVWSQLGELIGSADGKKFRNFAQQLTLDILLGYGNRHLQTLSHRYRLDRIKDSLGLLVVDQDMGDEVRSVHSLSGGESFLVSLAMALGLASLSSHRVKVESLFIDEGFGSLDADSLRVAMDALDSLQAQGRKVGVISHVQEMTERIGTRVQVQRQSGGLSRIVVA